VLGTLFWWVILGIFLIATVVLLSGKGSNLVAGFNTISKDEKAKYDKVKVSKQAGKVFVFADISILIFGLYFQFMLVPAINANTIESMGREIVTVALSIASYIIILCIVACSKGFKSSKR
jgi:hypothetical protein